MFRPYSFACIYFIMISSFAMEPSENRLVQRQRLNPTDVRYAQPNSGKLREERLNLKELYIQPEGFECCICFESRFVSLKSDTCMHEFCANCINKTFQTENLQRKCSLCRKDFGEFETNFHSISDLKPDEYANALYYAAQEGKLDIVKFIAKQAVNLNISLNDLVTPWEETPVRAAASNGHFDIVKFLAEQGVDLDKVDCNDGATPLYVAALEGHFEIVKYLAEQKVDLDKDNFDGATPVCIAAFTGHFNIVKFLAEQKADLNKAMSNGLSPLHAAASEGHFDIVKFFVEQKVDLIENDDGDTPADVAFQGNHFRIYEFLENQYWY